ncbi:MAG: HesA/MoeB/ThiF family protein [Actinomycetia bacterium]|nr:HesA/MoeB/ThiF family protein [Actinomycetes bacterium]
MTGVQIPLRRPVPPAGEGWSRYRRSWLVDGIGLTGQARLRAAQVLVVGAGGLGSPVLLYLAGAGVGRIGVADFDVVDETNLSRQVVHDQASVGQPKTASARTRLLALDPGLEVVELGRVTTRLLDEQREQWDLVVECSDTFDTKYLVADWCEGTGTPLVWGSVVDMVWQVSDFWSRPPAGWPATSLRRLHPRPPAPGQTPSSTEVGVLGPVVGQAGSAMATEAVKLVTGVGEPLIGQVLYGDSRRNRYQVLTYAGTS